MQGSEQTGSMTVANQQENTPQAEESIEQFLTRIEKRAYKMAEIATQNHAEALDILQDCMIKLVTHYSDKSSKQWQPLFYRILHNRIMDWHRHQRVKNMLFFWKKTDDDNQDENLVEQVAEPCNSLEFANGGEPVNTIEKAQIQQASIAVLSGLSAKQQQCFLLRSWEGLSVAETAEVMQCSEGSVKTHYHRAVQKMKQTLKVQHDYSF